jgi:hypothetical protein
MTSTSLAHCTLHHLDYMEGLVWLLKGAGGMVAAKDERGMVAKGVTAGRMPYLAHGIIPDVCWQVSRFDCRHNHTNRELPKLDLNHAQRSQKGSFAIQP